MAGLPTVETPCALCGGDRADAVWTTPDRVFAVSGTSTVRSRDCGFSQRPRVRDDRLPETLERAVEKAGGRVVRCRHQADPRVRPVELVQ